MRTGAGTLDLGQYAWWVPCVCVPNVRLEGRRQRGAQPGAWRCWLVTVEVTGASLNRNSSVLTQQAAQRNPGPTGAAAAGGAGPKGEGGLDDAPGAGGSGGASHKQTSNTLDLGAAPSAVQNEP
jgi:hypothetical protein